MVFITSETLFRWNTGWAMGWKRELEHTLSVSVCLSLSLSLSVCRSVSLSTLAVGWHQLRPCPASCLPAVLRQQQGRDSPQAQLFGSLESGLGKCRQLGPGADGALSSLSSVWPPHILTRALEKHKAPQPTHLRSEPPVPSDQVPTDVVYAGLQYKDT